MGFSYFSERVIAEPHIVNKKSSPTTFLCPYIKEEQIEKSNRLGDLGGVKKQILETIKNLSK